MDPKVPIGESDPEFSKCHGRQRTVRGRHGRPQTKGCQHEDTVTVRSAGIQRVVCEGCGHVSFDFIADLTEEIDRDQFARAQDDIQVVA